MVLSVAKTGGGELAFRPRRAALPYTCQHLLPESIAHILAIFEVRIEVWSRFCFCVSVESAPDSLIVSKSANFREIFLLFDPGMASLRVCGGLLTFGLPVHDNFAQIWCVTPKNVASYRFGCVKLRSIVNFP